MLDSHRGGDFKIIAFITFLLHRCQFKFIWDVIFLLAEGNEPLVGMSEQ